MIFVECYKCKQISEYCCGRYWRDGKKQYYYFRHNCKIMGSTWCNTMIHAKELKTNILCAFELTPFSNIQIYGAFDKKCKHNAYNTYDEIIGK